jgi:multicomponent Na+:H+ antiporter subunit G
MQITEIIAAIFIFLGTLCCLTTVIGFYRLHDFFQRCHVAGIGDTMGLCMTCIGFIILLKGANILSVKLILLFLLVCVCNPIGTHIITRTARRTGFTMKLADDPPEENHKEKE